MTHWFTSYSGEGRTHNTLTVSKKDFNREDLNPLIKEITIQKKADLPIPTRYKIYTDYLPSGATLRVVPDENGTLVKWEDVKHFFQKIEKDENMGET